MSSGKIKVVEHASIPSQRIAYLDVAKGIGILLVVLGHNAVKDFLPWMDQFIFSFHMPFFFLLSGMLFKPKYPLPVLFKRRFTTLIIPYLTTIFLLYSIYLFFTETPLITILQRILRNLYASGHYIEWAQMWFLPHLFVLNLFAGALFLLFYRRIEALWLRLTFLAGLLWGGIAFLPVFYMKEVSLFGKTILLDGLPLSIDLLFITAAFFLIGYEIRRVVPERFFRSRWALVLSGMLLLVLNIIFPYRINLFIRVYESFIVNTLEALAGSIFILALSNLIAEREGKLYSILNYFGQITIVLLIFHQPAQRITFYKMLDLIDIPYLAGLVSFIVSVGIPVLIYQMVLRHNPRLATWFGVRQIN